MTIPFNTHVKTKEWTIGTFHEVVGFQNTNLVLKYSNLALSLYEHISCWGFYLLLCQLYCLLCNINKEWGTLGQILDENVVGTFLQLQFVDNCESITTKPMPLIKEIVEAIKKNSTLVILIKSKDLTMAFRCK